MENNGVNQHDLNKIPNLFLLIGTNPLPNYVAAKLLWARDEENAKLYFVYTKDTKKYVDTLITELALRVCENLVLIDVEDESDTKKIYDMVRAEVQKLKNNGVTDEKIGLNYTGGTKTMAVHAYRAIRELAEEAQKTYLDARKLRMVIEKKGEKNEGFPTRDRLQLNIDTFLNLHQYSYRTKRGQPEKPRGVEGLKFPDLSRDIGVSDLRKKIYDWSYKNYRVEIENNEMLKGNEKEKAKSELPLPLPDLLSEHYANCRTVGEFSAARKLTPTEICKYFEGEWLEEYVLLALSDLFIKFSNYSFGIDVKAIRGTIRDFQIDDYAIKGYQLFAVSCNTGDKTDTLKYKLFEILVRARQIGGDEARVALVCGYNNPGCLENQLIEGWNLPDGMVRVFGNDDLPKLSEKLENWINNQ